MTAIRRGIFCENNCNRGEGLNFNETAVLLIISEKMFVMVFYNF